MKKVITMSLLIMFSFALVGCVGSRLITDIAKSVGDSDMKAVTKGTPAAGTIMKSWPYIHGQIKGVMGQSYEFDLSPYAIAAAERLDELTSKKEPLSPGEMGELNGARVRFGWYWSTYIKDKYGMPLWDQIKSYTGLALPF